MNNLQTHASELELDAEKAKIRQSDVLIPYSIFGTILWPLVNSSLDPKEIENTFPSYNSRKPRIFLTGPHNMSFMSQRNFRSAPSSLHTSTYLEWSKGFSLY